MGWVVELSDELQGPVEALAAKRGQRAEEVVQAALARYLGLLHHRYPDGLASLAEEDPALAAELAAWDSASDEAWTMMDEEERA